MFASLSRTATDINQAMARVYAHMMIAVLFSMFTSYAVGTSPQLMAVLFTGFTKWIVIFAPLLFIFLVPVIVNARVGVVGLSLMLYSFASLMGLSMATIFVAFSLGSIFTAFMGAAVLFAVMSFYGYFTKRDLSNMGDMLMIALIAIIIASLINIFVGSTIVQMIISAIAIVVFLGFTAYDTQTIREQLMEGDDYVVEILGALNLYLDFMNIFINLLQLIGVAPNSDD